MFILFTIYYLFQCEIPIGKFKKKRFNAWLSGDWLAGWLAGWMKKRRAAHQADRQAGRHARHASAHSFATHSFATVSPRLLRIALSSIVEHCAEPPRVLAIRRGSDQGPAGRWQWHISAGRSQERSRDWTQWDRRTARLQIRLPDKHRPISHA